MVHISYIEHMCICIFLYICTILLLLVPPYLLFLATPKVTAFDAGRSLRSCSIGGEADPCHLCLEQG